MHEYEDSARSDRNRERSHRRKKHREEAQIDTASEEAKSRRSHRRHRRSEPVVEDVENAVNYYADDDNGRQRDHPIQDALDAYPQEDGDNYSERNGSISREGKHRRGSSHSKHRHRQTAREPDYVNAGFSQSHSQYSGDDRQYPYQPVEESEELVEEQAGYAPSVDENYPEHAGSVLSGSQIRSGSVSYHPELDTQNPTNYSRSGSQLDPSVHSVSDYGAHSVNSATPRTVGGGEPGYWNLDDGRHGSMPQTVLPDSIPEPASGRPTALKKFLASFRRLRPKSSTAALRANPDATDSAGSIVARVIMLDGEEVTYQLDRNDTGQTLFTRVCQTADLVETDYFGLTYVSNKLRTWFWLDMDRKISKQLRNGEQWVFSFQVRFYPPEPTLLQEDITRYLLTLQVRQDIYTGKLPCSWVTQALLGSFMVQAELGDYDEKEYGGSTQYLNEFEFVPSPTPQLLQKIAELHKTHVGMKPNQADIKYLETAKRLELYGVDLHPVRDMENVEIYMGVGFHGIVIYRDRLRIGRFAWPKVLRISYKKNNFYLKIRPDNTEPVEAVIGFRLLNHYLANRLWKAAVEHHAFFRLKEARSPKGPSIPLNQKFAYTGRTFFQYRTMNINRPHPHFDRSLMKRRTASMPTGLNKAGSIHTLNRAHPRDMTVGRTQESDNFGIRRSGSSQIPISSAGHASSAGQLFGTVPRGSRGPYDDRSQLSRMTSETGGRGPSYASGTRVSSVSGSKPREYVNYPKGQSRWHEETGSAMSGSVITESTARKTSVGSRQPERQNERRPLSPVYVNTPARSDGKLETPSELDQSSSGWHESEQSSGGHRPPRGGVPALGGMMLQSQSTRSSHSAAPVPRTRHRQDQPEEVESELFSDDQVEEPAYTNRESQRERRHEHGKHRQPKPLTNHIPRRHHEKAELML